MTQTTILVADDDPVTRKTLTAGLQGLGYAVLTATDVIQTVRVTQKDRPAAIVLDVMMPGGTGIEVLKRVRASLTMGFIPIIVISGMADDTLPARVKELGAAEFLAKPVDIQQLADALSRVLGPMPRGPVTGARPAHQP